MNPNTIPATVITSNENTAMPSTDIDDFAPALFISAADQATFELQHPLKRSSLIFLNDAYVSPDAYSGIGTYSLVFKTPLDQYDKVLITF